MKHRLLSTILATTLLGVSMQGCIFVAGAAVGAATAGAVVFDKRTAKQTDDDKYITQEIEGRLNDNEIISKTSHIEVVTFNRVVLLVGDVPNEEMKAQVSSIAKNVPNIQKLYNQITISGKPSALSRVNDAYITAKIKTQMVATEDLQSTEIQVVTVAGTVFLLGKLSQEQGQVATDIAQHVSGVEKVVRVFEYN